mmetsp:Transcript_2838/g.4730  ORF Transcript_2838/g.4730 Transcript_2838/m.4730 type:complete len:209 (-) Transcript_2838:592-1218(-)
MNVRADVLNLKVKFFATNSFGHLRNTPRIRQLCPRQKVGERKHKRILGFGRMDGASKSLGVGPFVVVFHPRFVELEKVFPNLKVAHIRRPLAEGIKPESTWIRVLLVESMVVPAEEGDYIQSFCHLSRPQINVAFLAHVVHCAQFSYGIRIYFCVRGVLSDPEIVISWTHEDSSESFPEFLKADSDGIHRVANITGNDQNIVLKVLVG